MLYGHSWSHVNATEGQRSAGPKPVLCLKEDELQMDRVGNTAVNYKVIETSPKSPQGRASFCHCILLSTLGIWGDLLKVK